MPATCARRASRVYPLRVSRLAQLQKLLAADPADADVLYMLAQEHAKAGEHIAAIGWYDRCLSAAPAYHYAYFHKGKAQEAAGDIPAARATLSAGLAAASRARDSKAAGEIEAYLDELDPA